MNRSGEPDAGNPHVGFCLGLAAQGKPRPPSTNHNIDHKLLMKAVRKHTDNPWVILYIERWLKAPFQLSDGTVVERTRGTPQGGVISPVLVNLFLHYALQGGKKIRK
ncbi:reverse transcriptase domain-containing protein [Alicyclobacillus herbarius]|uniref:reverse transcriptase domain-containing protein n=1 Tax=Alicyclobacillus herbarius TaxID=122960 RepID=UPI000424B5F0|nr:reverse transcriptase domain-containing protein [Alicyclobacillus herbarius]